MKLYFLIIITFWIGSCKNGTAEAEEAYIKSRIQLHTKSFLKFIVDSQNKRTAIKAKALWQGKPASVAEQYADSMMRRLYHNRNVPYRPEEDAHLTYESFITYCRLHHLDPVRRVRQLK